MFLQICPLATDFLLSGRGQIVGQEALSKGLEMFYTYVLHHYTAAQGEFNIPESTQLICVISVHVQDSSLTNYVKEENGIGLIFKNCTVVCSQIEQRDMAAAETLRAAFTKVIFLINIDQCEWYHFKNFWKDESILEKSNLYKQVEAQHPGFSYDLIKGILRRGDVLGGVDMTECLLRLEGLNNSDGMYILRGKKFKRNA